MITDPATKAEKLLVGQLKIDGTSECDLSDGTEIDPADMAQWNIASPQSRHASADVGRQQRNCVSRYPSRSEFQGVGDVTTHASLLKE
jgi:hypothetical protein